MNRMLELTDEEIHELDFLTRKELQSTEIELNHTRAFAYKDALKERLRLLELLLPKLSGFKPAPAQVMPGTSTRPSPDGVRHH